MQNMKNITSLTDYSSVNLTPMSERLLKITWYYKEFNKLKQEGKVDDKVSYIISLLLEREELFKRVILLLSKGLCLQEYRIIRKNKPFYYASHHHKVSKLNELLRRIRTIDVILFSEMGEDYTKWLEKEFKIKNLVIVEEVKNTLWSVYLWNGDGYYFMSFIYKEGVEGVKKVFKKYYSILQLLTGELCLGYGGSFTRRHYFYPELDDLNFINELYGDCNKHSVGEGVFTFYFKYIKRDSINLYRELCDFIIEEVELYEIERFIVSWDEVIMRFNCNNKQ